MASMLWIFPKLPKITEIHGLLGRGNNSAPRRLIAEISKKSVVAVTSSCRDRMVPGMGTVRVDTAVTLGVFHGWCVLE